MGAGGGLDPVGLYDYLVKARARVLEQARGLTLEQYTRKFPFGPKTLRNTLVEIPSAEWNYVRRLQGEQERPPERERPFFQFYETEFAPLERAWLAQAEETRRTLEEIEDWNRPLTYVVRFVAPGDAPYRVRTTTGGVATQLVLHEVHHRAQAMAMLRQLGAPVEDLDFSLLTFLREGLPA